MRAARAQHVQPLRWPEPFPADSEFAMLVATYAKQIGRAVAFSLAAFRQAFAGGRDLGERDTVLLAAAACEMHPVAVVKGAELRGTRERLAAATAEARAAGVREVPAVVTADGRVLEVPVRMKANRAFELKVHRGGRGPALLRSPGRGRPHRGARDRHRRDRAVLGHVAEPDGQAGARAQGRPRAARRRRVPRALAPVRLALVARDTVRPWPM